MGVRLTLATLAILAARAGTTYLLPPAHVSFKRYTSMIRAAQRPFLPQSSGTPAGREGVGRMLAVAAGTEFAACTRELDESYRPGVSGRFSSKHTSQTCWACGRSDAARREMRHRLATSMSARLGSLDDVVRRVHGTSRVSEMDGSGNWGSLDGA
nr:hypothetical protein CFP56_09026 [Quercus suber]